VNNANEAIGDPASVIEAWREQGDHRFDPVRFRFLEALVRRAAGHRGEARRVLDDKVARLLATYGENLDRARCAPPAAAAPAGRTPGRGPLAELVEHIARHASVHEDGAAAAGMASPAPSSAPELKTLRYFRSTWTRLSADRRLTQSLAKVPENAGPLNSHHLVHQSLSLMRELSPEYLERFVSYVDTLLWIDGANGSGVPAAAQRTEKPRKTEKKSDKKTARGRPG
jgi:hypothetical protein